MAQLYLTRPVASQPGGGGSELGLVEHQAHPPLGHCPRDVINLKNAPTLGHSQAPPPLGHCPCDVIHIFQGWNKIAEGWNKIAKGWNKIFGMGNWGGVVRPPRPPPPLATGLLTVVQDTSLHLGVHRSCHRSWAFACLCIYVCINIHGLWLCGLNHTLAFGLRHL